MPGSSIRPVGTVVAAVAAAALFWLAAQADAGREADLVISEISATSSRRDLRWVESGETRAAAGDAWYDLDFDDRTWRFGTGSFGYGDGDDTTVVDLRGKAFSLYLRTEFHLTEAQSRAGGPWILEVDFDDGFVAYIDGREVARANLGAAGERIGHGRAADTFSEAGEPVAFPVPASQGLEPGRHVLALQGHNVSLGSSDFTLRAELRSAGDPPTLLVGPENGWSFFVGVSEPPGPLASWRSDRSRVARLGAGPHWMDVGFSDRGWQEGNGIGGFGRGDEDTVLDNHVDSQIGLNAQSLIHNRNPALLLNNKSAES